MYLGSLGKRGRQIDTLRELTTDEMERHTAYTPIVCEARNRLVLFRMLNRNYLEWKSYLNRLLSSNFKEDVDISEELNRLLLNYLTFAYSIEAHFAVSFRRRFKKGSEGANGYFRFLEKLYAGCWPFAFMLDFRGYVQHYGLGVGHYNRHASDHSVKIQVDIDAETLLEDGYRWRRSGLNAAKGKLDLIDLMKEFHIQMLQSYASYVAKTFFPELLPASEFYAELTKEVRDRFPDAQMVFVHNKPEFTPQEGGKYTATVNFSYVANDVFGELGIKVNP